METLDDIIGAQYWNGTYQDVLRRKAGIRVDNQRLGSLPFELRSARDTSLVKRQQEVHIAATILALLGHMEGALTTKAADGEALECPDLDMNLAGETIGIEIAFADDESAFRTESLVDAIETHVNHLLESDRAFQSVFGSYHVTINLDRIGGEAQHLTAPEKGALIAEIEDCLRNAHHIGIAVQGYAEFGPHYNTLHARGCSIDVQQSRFPYFGLAQSLPRRTITRESDVLRVLNDHRKKARSYRTKRTWMMIYIPAADELFTNTLQTLRQSPPDIAPFEQLHVADAVHRVISFPKPLPLGS